MTDDDRPLALVTGAGRGIGAGTAKLILAILLFNIASVAGTNSKNQIFISDISIDSKTGVVRITDSAGTRITPPKEDGQVSCQAAKVAEDKQSAGWLVDYQNCCTSYPIPLTLVIYREGKPPLKLGDGLMLGDWYFLDGGKRVAFSSNSVHPHYPSNYLLYDVSSGQLLKKWNGNPGEHAPEWTKVFEEH